MLHQYFRLTNAEGYNTKQKIIDNVLLYKTDDINGTGGSLLLA